MEQTLDRLIERGFVVRQPRRPGQKEERYAHLLSADLEDEGAPAPAAAAAQPQPSPARAPEGDGRDERLDMLEARLEALAAEVADLRASCARKSAEVADLRAQLGG
jgi:uncharacterized protein